MALCRLNMLRHERLARCEIRRRQVALQANRVHIGLNQQVGIRSPVRDVACSATFRADRGVPIDERAGRRGVAFGAYIELPC